MDRVLSLIGLAYRAGKISLGEECLHDMKRIRFLFIAADASDGTKERYLKKCHYYGTPYSMKYDTQELSAALGRKTVKIAGITDEGFTVSIRKSLV